MTPAEEQAFIQLWQAGTETAAIAQALGIPVGTVSSRAHGLQRQGKIQPRPRGGSHSRRVAQARQPRALSETTETPPVHNSAPVQRPVHMPPDQTPASPDLSGVLNALVERLSAIEETLKQRGVQGYAPVQVDAPVQGYAPV